VSMSPYDEPPVPAGPAGASGAVERHRPESRDVQRLRDWADAATAAYRVAQSLCKTSFVPVHYRGKPEEATAAILAGNELDLSPIASLNAFYPIQGTSAPKAITLRAVVQARGHEITLVETTEQRCVMRGRRRGAQDWQQVTWTLQRATRLGLTQREQWKKQPQAMLVARATSEIARLIASDALMGIPYSYEELADTIPPETETVRRTGKVRRATPAGDPAAVRPAEPPAATSRPLAPGLASAPASDETRADTDPVDAETVDTDDDTSSETDDPDRILDMEDRIMRRLFALLHEAEVPDRHAFASKVLGRKVESFKGEEGLKQREAQVLITALQDDLNEDRRSRDAYEGNGA
jgi:hypothetical protein